jgi:hypothetical protein
LVFGFDRSGKGGETVWRRFVVNTDWNGVFVGAKERYLIGDSGYVIGFQVV